MQEFLMLLLHIFSMANVKLFVLQSDADWQYLIIGLIALVIIDSPP